MKIKFTYLIVFFLALLVVNTEGFAQGNTCASATPFCTTSQNPGFTWPNTSNGSTAQSGPSYGCLGSEPNPSWFYLETTAAGAMTFTLSQVNTGGTGIDVDFVAWGPFTAAQFPTACSNLTGGCSGGSGNLTPNPGCSGGIIDCSYSTSATENMTINSPGANMFYIIMITNYNGSAGTITFTQTGGPFTNCAITCPTTLPLAAEDAGTFANIPNGSTLSCTQGQFWIYANEPNNGTVGNVYTDIFTPCIDVDFKYYAANLGANETLNLYENGVYSNCIGPSAGCAFPIGGGTAAVGSIWDLLWNYLDPGMSHDFAFCHAGNVATTTVTIEDCWKQTPIVPSFTIGTASPGCFTVNIPAGTGIGVASFSIAPSGSGSITDYHDGYVLINPTTMAAGTYTVTYSFTGTNCPKATGTFVFTVPVKPVISITSTNPVTICRGQSTTLTANATGGTISTYTWTASTGLSATTGTSVVASPTTTTVYTVNATNTAGCSGATPATVTVNVTPLPSLTITPVPAALCSGSSSTLTASGGTTYTWSANAGSATTSTVVVTPPTGTTIYTVSGTASSCTSTKTVSIVVTATPTVNISGTMAICSGQSTTLTGATASTYSWSVGSASSSISVSPSTTTTYTLTGSNGTCSTTAVATVTVTPTPTLTISGTTALCSGQSTTLTGATATAYTWNPGGATTNTVSVSPPTGTTNYTLTGANGTCVSTKTVAVTVTATPTVTISGTTNLCGGQSSVLTGATATGYTWSTGATTNTISVTPPVGSTTYTLTGGNGTCTASTTVTMSVTPSPTLTISGTTALCSGQSTLLTGATATGYTWSTGATTNTISVTPPTGTTTYTLNGSNGGACTATKTVAVVVTATPTLTISGTTAICSGQSTVLTGATAAGYTWSTGATTNTISVTPPTGTTSYTLTGANGACTSTKTVSVIVTATPTLSVSGTTAICSGQSTTLTGATAGAYTWNPGGVTTNTITVTPSTGTTNYTLTGANGSCLSTTITSVNVTATPTVTISGVTTICSGSSTILTGASAAAYSWSPGGATTNTITITPPVGSTTYTLTGNNGVCTASTTATVSVTPTPTVSISGNNDICSGQSQVLTGTTATNYTWNPGGVTTSTISVSPGSTTVYTLTGANGTCTATAIASLSVTPTPTVAISGAASICNGQSLVLTGATATSYTWAGGITTNTITVNPNSNTTYTLTGANGTCTASAVATVTVNPLPVIGTASITSAPCGQSTGCINSVSISGGAPTYSYSWNGGTLWSVSSTTCSIPAGTYPLQVIDANGCSANANISVPSSSGPSAPTAVPSATVACLGDSAVFVINPATAGITYTWTDYTGTHTGTSYTITNITPPGTYNVSVTATDINGCLSTATNLTLTVNSLPPTSVSGTSHFCKGTSTVLNASPSGSGYSYQWSQGGISIGGATAATYTANAAGNYGIVITDNTTGCKAASVGNYTVTIDSLPKIDTTSMVITNSNCSSSTGSVISVTVNPSAGNAYSWTNSSGTVVGTSINLNNVPAGSYCLLVTTNPDNCRDSICGVTVNNAGAPPVPTVTTPNNTYCLGQTQSPIVVSGTGTFSWYSDAGLTTQIATGTTYTPNVVVTTTLYVTATNSGCQSASTPVVITINPNPTAPILSGSASNPLVECQGSTAQSVNVATTGTVTSVPVWYNGSTWVTTGTSYTPSTSTPGTTVYTIIDSASVTGCKDTSASNVLTVTVTINPTPTPPTLGGSATNPLVECQGSVAQPIVVVTTGTVTSVPVWYNGSGYVTTGTTYTPSTATPGTTVYTITDSATVAGGCSSATTGGLLTVTVTINATPANPTVSAPSYTSCAGQTPNTITATGTGTILWSTSPTMSPVVNTGSTYTPSGATPGTTVYYIQDSLNNGCKSATAATSVTVTVNATPSVTGTPSFTTAACGNLNGGIGGLTATGGTPGYTYQWIDVSTGSVISTSADLTGMGVGNYSLVVTDTNGCQSSGTTNSYSVSGSAAISASFTASATSGQAPLNVTFTNGSVGAAGYNWTFATSTDTSSAVNPSFPYTTAGTYTVMLIASNGTCADTAYEKIVVDVATSIIIPNIFSPNGDGLNDEFIITCTGMKSLRCEIFNRWGQLVYTLTAPNQNWDGKLNNGNMATEGTYYFMLNAVGVDSKTYTYQGPITLVK